MTNINEAIRRLNLVAMEAISDYNRELARGGAPVSPDWTEDLLQLIEAHAAAIQTATCVRDMLREDFYIADNRDAAVAESVRAWYLRQYPHLAVLADQPDLASIIEGVRAVPADGNLRPPLRFKKIIDAMHREESPTLQVYLADQLKGGAQ